MRKELWWEGGSEGGGDGGVVGGVGGGKEGVGGERLSFCEGEKK